MASVARELLLWEEEQRGKDPKGGHKGTSSPESKRLWQARLKETSCTLCEACLRACHQRALRVERGEGGVRMLLDPQGCNGCRHCERLCPEKALTIEEAPARELSTEGQVVGEWSLDLCQGCGAPLGASALLLKIAVVSPERVGASARLCPECKRREISDSVMLQGRRA
jgi:ferredoxin